MTSRPTVSLYSTAAMKGPAALAVISLCIAACTAHVSLVYPPARTPTYDFLDNVRTGGPCGVPCEACLN